MFLGCTRATVGWAKTTTDANFFNNTTGKPSNLIFQTKTTPVRPIILTDYYVYILDSVDNVYYLSLTDNFKTQLNKASGGSFIDGNGNVWVTGNPLPNPGSTYNWKNVTGYGSIFANCNVMTSLDLSLWDTSNVTNMRDMFAVLS